MMIRTYKVIKKKKHFAVETKGYQGDARENL